MKKYKDTLNLPKTSFPIKSKPARELELLKKWNEENLYNALREHKKDKPEFILHSGPPYVNSKIHGGHILNAALKDIVIRHKCLSGYKPNLKLGFDQHGLPMELAVSKKHKFTNRLEFRQRCREHAEKYASIQLKQFNRLGALHDGQPYHTMSPEYEAQTLRELAKLVDAGLLYKDLRPVFWCPTHRTALADSEIEYVDDHESLAVYVLYCLNNGEYVAVWTTTPWTLPANFGLAVKSDAMYRLYNINGKNVWMAEDRLPVVLSDLELDLEDSCYLTAAKGTYFCGLSYESQFENHVGGIIEASDHVTTDSGTGFVHIAPAHGEDDFRFGKKYNLPVVSVIGDNGKTVYPIESMCGMSIKNANEEVADYLFDAGLLLKAYKHRHRYPYSARAKRPVITKTTKQWFVHLDKPYNDGPSLRERALEALDDVKWIPGHGYNRIKSMLESRPDWCLSRQRTWGVPIPQWECNKCNYVELNSDYIEVIAANAELSKLDEWFSDEQYVDAVCPNCEEAGGYFPGRDILDVWFDSGVSNAAVMGGKTVDLYLEGSDQHRGWFQSTLLASLGCRELLPYKTVLTHGFVVDDKGEKLSKSKGNYVDPFKSIESDGAELWRLWVAMSEFKNDVRVSQVVLDGVKQVHHKIRNTIRFMLSNLNDFSVSDDAVYPAGVDDYILTEWHKVYNKCIEAYNNYEFHTIVHSVLQFCTNELSSFYFDAVKDILYCDKPDSPARRGVQTVLYSMALNMIKLMAPIMSFSMEDAWGELTKQSKSVLFETAADTFIITEEFNFHKYEDIREVRDQVFLELEKAREAKLIGPFYEAFITLYLPPDKLWDEVELARLFLVSRVIIKPHHTLGVEVARATGPQCQRCWSYRPITSETDVCDRCVEALDANIIS